MSDISEDDKSAFILRIRPSGENRVSEALECDHLIIGWSCAPGLLDEILDWERFRGIVHESYGGEKSSLRSAASGAGNMWRFIRDMKKGDLVVVPDGPEFYVAEVAGDPFFDESKINDDTAYRRPAKWLNGRKPIPREHAKSALFARMKARQTCAWAQDLIGEIEECLDSAEKDEEPLFEEALAARLTKATLAELRSGHMNPRAFEELISRTFKKLGAEAKVIPTRSDTGVDVLARFHVGGRFPLAIGIQAKYWEPEPAVGRDVVQQLVHGIEASGEEIGYGMVITTGTIGDEAVDAAEKYTNEKGVPIELLDGEAFARLLVQNGVSVT